MNDVKHLSLSPPHIRARLGVGGIMLGVIFALLPMVGFGIYRYGLAALFLVLTTVLSAVLAEFICNLIFKRPVSLGDYSAVVTGMILAVCLPPYMPLWLGAVGAVFAILVVKMPFGGLGQNILNPAMAAYCFLALAYAPVFAAAQSEGAAIHIGLVTVSEGNVFDVVVIWDFLISLGGGTIGEAARFAPVIGAILLLLFGIITLRIPLTYILSFMLFLSLFAGAIQPTILLIQVISGGLLLAAFFAAGDYVTRPKTAGGQIIYAMVLGFFTALFRYYGAGMEGCAFAIIIGNLLVPLIDICFPGAKRAKGKIDV